MLLLRVAVLLLIISLISAIPLSAACQCGGSDSQSGSQPTDGGTLFAEDFETGDLEHWELDSGWSMETTAGNTFLKGTGHSWATVTADGWTDYAFRANFRLVEGTIHFNFRHNPGSGPSRYLVGVTRDRLYLQKQMGTEFTEIAEARLAYLDDGWHQIEIRGYQGILNVYSGSDLVLVYKDEDAIRSGGIAFETLEGSQFMIDDVKVVEVSAEDVVADLEPIRVQDTERKGVLARDEVWSGQITVSGVLEVPEGITLSIEPGTRVEFRHYRGYREPQKKSGLTVQGVLKAIGTPGQQIWFTSDAEDPVNGDWHMIRFVGAQSDSIIKYAVVEFAQQGINMWNCSPTISHTIVRWNNWEGIYLESYCQPLLEYNLIYENGYNGVAMEQFNDATLRYNTVLRSGTNGIHVDASTAIVKGCVIAGNNANGLSVDDHGTIYALDNTIEGNNGAGIGLGEGTNTVIAHGNKFVDNASDIGPAPPGTMVQNISGEGAGEIEYDYPDSRPYELGYIPGDEQKDRCLYVYPDDETRKVLNKIGAGLGLTWSVTWDGSHVWTATLWGRVYRLDPSTGEIDRQWDFPGPQAWGMTYDGSHLWINDFAEKRVYEMDTDGNVISSFAGPDPVGGTKGITWDGQCLCIMGWTSPTIYRVDKSGNLIETIDVKGGNAGGGLTWDGQYFWAPGGKGICKINRQGEIVGGVYPASEGTWDLAWDGQYLWATQRTNENWLDAKVYQLEILDDSLN
jgi:hypothetical protein